MAKPIKIDIWSDIACPWCYLGKRRLEEALASFEKNTDAPSVTIEYHSFELMPDAPTSYDGTYSDYLAARMGWSSDQVDASSQQMAQLGAPLGLDFRIPAIKIANTLKAHQLLHYAKSKGKQVEMKERLFQAYFTEGHDVGRDEQLADLAAEVGLDRDEVLQVLARNEFAEAVKADEQQAGRLGVRGVPFYVLDNKYGLSGAQEPATLLRALEQTASEQRGAA